MITDLSKSILILDDDAIFRGIVHDLLKVRGLVVVEARSANEADGKLGGFSPALAIVDYRLPESDGVSWITKMRESGRNFPIIFCSGTWCDEKTFNWLRNILRVTMILRKPIDPALFVQQIESLMPQHILMEAQRNVAEMVPMVVTSLQAKEGHALKTADDALLAEVRGVQAKMARQQQFAQVRTSYGKELEASWQQLIVSVEQARADLENTLCVSEAIQLAHRIRGTAGTLGFDRIGLAAGKVEDLMRALDPQDTMLGVLWSEIDRAIESGNQSLQEHLALLDSSTSVTDEVVYSKILLVGADSEANAVTRNLQTRIPVEFVLAESSASVALRVKQTALDGAIIDLALERNLSRLCNLISEVRSVPAQNTLPVAFIAAGTNPPEPAQVLYAGASVCLQHKPDRMDMQQLADALLDLRQKNKPKVLTVDDDQMLTGFIASILSAQHMSVRSLNQPILIMEAMEEFQPDLVLLDVIMPGLSGYDVCRMLRSTPPWSDLPILFLTSRSDAEGRSSAFQAGGNDFLSKPVLADELIARVKAQLSKSRPNAQDQAMLSGKEFIETCEAILQVPDRSFLPLSVCLLGIDDFVNLGVVHGFHSTQEVTDKLTQLLHERFRNEDVRARLSEDGFAIAFPGTDKEVAAEAMQLFLTEFSDLRFSSSTMGNFKVTFCAGVSDSTEGETIHMLLSVANRKFVESKRTKFGAVTAS